MRLSRGTAFAGVTSTHTAVLWIHILALPSKPSRSCYSLHYLPFRSAGMMRAAHSLKESSWKHPVPKGYMSASLWVMRAQRGCFWFSPLVLFFSPTGSWCGKISPMLWQLPQKLRHHFFQSAGFCPCAARKAVCVLVWDLWSQLLS